MLRFHNGRFVFAAGALLSTALLMPVHAQESAAPAKAPRPCAEAAEYQQFDFWVGHWEVTMEDGRKAGNNHVSRIDGGCVVQEKWTSVAGGTGSSLNYYDVGTGEWVQNWVGAGGTFITIRGGIENGSMVLEGRISYASNGVSNTFRGTWTPLEDGRVRQYFQESEDEGVSWKDWFEGYYTRMAADD